MLHDALDKDFDCVSSTDNEECIDSTSTNTNHPEIGVGKGVLKNFTRSSGDVAETKIAADWKGGENCPKGTRPEEIDASGEVGEIEGGYIQPIPPHYSVEPSYFSALVRVFQNSTTPTRS